MSSGLLSLELSRSQFEEVSQMLYRWCGIKLHEGKTDLVKSRLLKRLRDLGIDNFSSYLTFVKKDASGRERVAMIDVLTTNKTSFFREERHFDFMRERVIPSLRAQGRIRIWSAGCSTGAEPYTLAIVLCEEIPEIDRLDVRILATDISTRVLKAARDGVYDADELADVPRAVLHKRFDPLGGSPSETFRVKPNLRGLVHPARLNLVEDWPMKGPLDAIFCRNVMIYFDKPTQETLVHRFWELLKPGGYLFIGHSESVTAWADEFRYIQPAVYQK